MKKFYRAVFQVEVVSDEPIPDADLDVLHAFITDGPGSGNVVRTVHEEITGKAAAELLVKQGSDPSFLGLDADGNVEEDA